MSRLGAAEKLRVSEEPRTPSRPPLCRLRLHKAQCRDRVAKQEAAMLLLCQPPLSQQAEGAYQCADIRALYHWLEAHDYHYFGSFGPEQYGRFSYLEIALGDNGPVHHTSSIEVHLNGAVVATDALAQRLLDTIC